MKEGSPIHVFLYASNHFVVITVTTYTYLNCKFAQILMLYFCSVKFLMLIILHGYSIN